MRACVRDAVRPRSASARLATERPLPMLAFAACLLRPADAIGAVTTRLAVGAVAARLAVWPVAMEPALGPVAANLAIAPGPLPFPVILRWPRFCAALEGCTATARRTLPVDATLIGPRRPSRPAIQLGFSRL